LTDVLVVVHAEVVSGAALDPVCVSTAGRPTLHGAGLTDSRFFLTAHDELDEIQVVVYAPSPRQANLARETAVLDGGPAV
jgi:hypothetical protein